MMDSSSKFQAGIFIGNVVDLGAFDECLRIDNNKEHIRGKYCLTKLEIPLLHNKSLTSMQNLWTNLDDFNRPENFASRAPDFTRRWSICVPDGCTAKDVQEHLNSLNQNFNFTVQEKYCQTVESQPKLNFGDWVTMYVHF
ncbi:uncharacterized protein LOC123301114 [Chrysoperla carnea]|uniref:uncharacterized protein LOC123301114 n=1 Tax=Chrysoperla carnea TaxID=189513 RepID=UPI001D05E14C|nr:uncharacterized protein LOC123301114 [Chrysoperla carnea]